MSYQGSHPVQYESVDRRNPWSPGAFRRLPWQGLAAFTGCVIGLAASAAVLVASDGKLISSWSYQPATYLAIATVVTNVCLFYILKEGVNVAWWRLASNSGTAVGDLHQHWNFGTSFQDALLAGRKFNFIAFACVFATIAQINSPLLQRASRAVVEPIFSYPTIHLRLAQSLPLGYTGMKSGREYAVSLFSQEFGKVVQSFNNNGTIAMTDTGCQAKCSASVKGIGLGLNCSSYTVPFNLNPAVTVNGVYNVSADPAVNGTYVFQTGFRWSAYEPNNVSLDVLYKSTNECDGVLHVTNCTIHPAVVNYKVIIDSNASTIALDPSTTIFNDVVVSPIAVLDGSGQGPTTLGGYWLALYNKYSSTAHLRFAGAVGYDLQTTGNSATQYVVANETAPDGSVITPFQLAISCNLYFSDPTNELLAAARDLMFRTSIAAANSSTPVQSVQSVQTGQRAVFRSDYAYMAAALGVTIIAMILALALFKGYWDMGRKTTLSPIEIARAFGAPLLRGSDSNAKVGDLIEEIGGRSVRYGAVSGDGVGQGDMVMDREGKYAYSSSNGVGTDFLGGAGDAQGMRLEMMAEQRVVTPREGWRFAG